MRLAAKAEVDIISLFLYGASWFPFSDIAIANAITEAAKDFTHTGEVLRIISPTDTELNRFTISWASGIRTSPKHYTKRVDTAEELRALVGARPIEILEYLNDTTLALS